MAREEKGYSKAWLHHKGRNKHHFEYWYDTDIESAPMMPFEYSVELICDMIAASMTYKKNDWRKEFPIEYWNKHKANSNIVNQNMKKFCKEVFTEISINGIDDTIKKKNLKRIYEKNST